MLLYWVRPQLSKTKVLKYFLIQISKWTLIFYHEQKRINFRKYREDTSLAMFSISLYNTDTETEGTRTPHFLSLDRMYLNCGWQRGQKRISQNYQLKRENVSFYTNNPKPKDWDQMHSVIYPYTSKWIDGPKSLAPDKMPKVGMGSLGWRLAQGQGLAWVGSYYKSNNSHQWQQESTKWEYIRNKKDLNMRNTKY